MSRQEDEKKKERNFGVIHSYFPSPATFFNNMHSRSDYDFLFWPRLVEDEEAGNSNRTRSPIALLFGQFVLCECIVWRLSTTWAPSTRRATTIMSVGNDR
jgi:hypothetical protein